jgi:Ca2+-binding RTX toxin-like protein
VTGAGEGTDTILDTVEIFQFADRTLTRAQMLTGLTAPTFTAGADTLSLPILGGTFDALGGNDRLTYTDGMVTIDGNSGTDTVDFTGFGSAVWVGLANVNGQAFTRDAANLNSGTWRTIGNLTNVENLTGTAFADYLAGDANANTFFYTGGVDTYDGAGGTDTVDYSLFTSAVSIELGTANPAWTRDQNNLNSGTWRSIGTLSNIENVVGTSFDDYLSGNSADNLLTGGSGNDTFAFRPSFGHDTVADFDPGHDILAFDHTLFATAVAAFGAAADDGGGNVVITLNANNTVTLTGVSVANLQPNDFRII